MAQDPRLHITTALLWIRSPHITQANGAANGVVKTPGSCLKDPTKATGKTDTNVQILEDQPDLGLLYLHRDRLTAAAQALQWQDAKDFDLIQASISYLREEIKRHLQDLPPVQASTLESRKIRILIDRHGAVQTDSTIIDLRPSPSQDPLLILTTPFIPTSLDQPENLDPNSNSKPCLVRLDQQPTQPSIFSSHKTTSREIYLAARARVNLASDTPPTTQEVLLYNTDGEVMETSACTIYFKRGDVWVTPSARCGPNLGVTRRLALERGLCSEGTIDVKGLRECERVWLSNAVRGFFRGVLQIDERTFG